MPTRKIKDAELDGEKVYFASHAKATYMSDGRTVEDAIKSSISGGSSGSGESSNARKEVVYGGGVTDYVITAMRPNVVYWLDNIKNVTIDSFEAPLQGVDSYDIFTVVMSLNSQMSNVYDVSLTLPDNILWANGQMPDLKEGAFKLSISRISDGDLSYYFAVLTPFDTIN